MLPFGAQPIAQARKDGQRPDAPVLVALGAIDLARYRASGNPVVVVPDKWGQLERIEWGWCIGLDVELVCRVFRGNDRAHAVLLAIAQARPRNLVAWETETGERWWFMDIAGAWPKPYRMMERDRSLAREAVAA